MLAAVRAVATRRGLTVGLDSIFEARAMNVAVVGATGAVGETILRVLEERDLPIARARAVRVARRARTRYAFAAPRWTYAPPPTTRCAISTSCSSPAAKTRANATRPALLERGSIVIDNSATFRMRQGVPLIVPEVNADVLRAEHRLFPVANCTAIVLCTALRPIRDAAGLRSVRVATYQAASGAGRPGLDELVAGEAAIAAAKPNRKPRSFRVRSRATSCRKSARFDDARLERRGAQGSRRDPQDARSSGTARERHRRARSRADGA